MALRLKFDLMDLLLRVEKDKQKQKALSQFVKREDIRREFGNRVIDEIKARTAKAKDKRGDSMTVNTPYSKVYRNSLPFRIYNKSRKVNLNLTGEMLASINVLRVPLTGTSVTIGFLSGEQDKKARGHVMGSGPLPVRDFWGIPVSSDEIKDQETILKGVIKDFNAREEANLIAQALAAVDTTGDIGLAREGEDELTQLLEVGFEEGRGEQ